MKENKIKMIKAKHVRTSNWSQLVTKKIEAGNFEIICISSVVAKSETFFF